VAHFDLVPWVSRKARTAGGCGPDRAP